MANLFSIIVIFLSSASFSVLEGSQNESSAGLTLSNISGYGVYYDVYRDPSCVVRPSVFLFYLERDRGAQEYSNLNYEIGLEVQRPLMSMANQSVYFVTGAYYYHDYEKTVELAVSIPKKSALDSFSIGFGFGLEKAFDNFVISIHGGYKLYDDRKLSTQEGTVDVNERSLKLKEGGGISLGFFL
jgi:hypothetical protein